MYYENLLRHQHQLLYMKEQVRQPVAFREIQSTFATDIIFQYILTLPLKSLCRFRVALGKCRRR